MIAARTTDRYAHARPHSSIPEMATYTKTDMVGGAPQWAIDRAKGIVSSTETILAVYVPSEQNIQNATRAPLVCLALPCFWVRHPGRSRSRLVRSSPGWSQKSHFVPTLVSKPLRPSPAAPS